jgi:hypothetical protein
MSATYTTRQDILDHLLIPSLTEPGVSSPDDYDLEAIIDRCFTYVPQSGGFIQIVGTDTFWAIVAEEAL